MPIINTDAKSLEWCTYLFLSQDKVGIPEWNNVIKYPDKYNDIHTTNQKAFKLPSRLIAKKLLFRGIYAESDAEDGKTSKAAFAFSGDPEFMPVSKSTKYWQQVLNAFFLKYKDLKAKHHAFIQEATTTGKIISPFGREYNFEQKQSYKGPYWAIPDILNWPNQGLGADIMAVARVVTMHGKRKRNIQGDLISTVHDSIVWDAATQSIPEIQKLMLDVFYNLPYYIKQYFGIDWNVELVCETNIGNNMKEAK